ncbi:MAG TPA: DedA family protein [Verrucomicrobiae bacterium]|nr:DedA family protein [Verrucomicrobiae bacterium]
MFKGLIGWYLAKLQAFGYPLIALLMAMESSILPLPSEFVIPPAAHLAHTNQVHLSIPGIILAGTLGSWLGASIMYWASRIAGRPLVLRYGRLALISPQKVEGAERWSQHYGAVGVFISRLLPVVRHLIGIPAGIVKMNFGLYSLFTVLGSAVWCGVLCYVGIKMGQDQELMKGELHRITIWLGGAVLFLGVVYYLFVHRQMRRKPLE